MPRKRREYESTCRCGAYPFPHRFGGGKCTGHHLASEAWYQGCGGHLRPCKDCNEAGDSCAVVDGRESPECCEAWQEYVNETGARIYKLNWK